MKQLESDFDKMIKMLKDNRKNKHLPISENVKTSVKITSSEKITS